MAKTFLFDEACELIAEYETQVACAKALGISSAAITSAIIRQQVIGGRYYVAETPRLPELREKGHERNLALNKRGSSHAEYNASDSLPRLDYEDLLGLELLASGLCFDWYLYGSTPLRIEYAESVPTRLIKD